MRTVKYTVEAKYIQHKDTFKSLDMLSITLFAQKHVRGNIMILHFKQ